jgi:hypothetical protein
MWSRDSFLSSSGSDSDDNRADSEDMDRLRNHIVFLAKKYKWHTLGSPIKNKPIPKKGSSFSMHELSDAIDEIATPLPKSLHKTPSVTVIDKENNRANVNLSTPGRARTDKSSKKNVSLPNSADLLPDDIFFRPNTKSKKLLAEREEITQLLYREYNQRAFDGQLPADLKVSWGKRLTTTAGITKMSLEPGTYKKVNHRECLKPPYNRFLSSIE